jgi:hypothetical protein
VRPIGVNLALYPGVGRLETGDEPLRWRPAEFSPDQAVIRIAASDAQWTRDVALIEPLSGDAHDQVSEMIDSHHFLGTNVHGPGETRAHQ